MSFFRIANDTGGLFKDTVLVDGQSCIVAATKLPMTPENPTTRALRGAQMVWPAANIPWFRVGGFIYGKTLSTKGLIEQRGAKVSTFTMAGFREILEIAY